MLGTAINIGRIARLAQQARRVGKVLNKEQLDRLQRLMDDDDEQQEERRNTNNNKRMNDFSTRMIAGMKERNRTLYAEERNIGNKEIIEDRAGLKNAYGSPSGLCKVGKTVYISGTTGKDGSITQDIIDDLIHLPSRQAEHTEKYRDVIDMLNKSPEITRLVGHSLASAVINRIK